MPNSVSSRRATLVLQRLLRRLFPSGNLPEPEDFVYFAGDHDKPLVAAYRSWETIEELAATDRVRLERGRAGFYDIKAKALDILARAARARSADGLWEKCFSLIADSVSADEAEFYLRVDRVYEGYDIKGNRMVDEDAGLIAGGLTALLETIGHYEKELKIGSLCGCKEALEAEGLAGLDEMGRGELRTSVGERARNYFDFVTDPKRGILDAALDEFEGLARQELRFWQEYTTRVTRDCENDLYEEVAFRKKVKRRFAHKFRPHLSRVADWVAGCLEVTGEVPAWADRNFRSKDSEPSKEMLGSGDRTSPAGDQAALFDSHATGRPSATDVSTTGTPRAKPEPEAAARAGHAQSVIIDVPSSECYGELDVIEKGRRVLRILKKKTGPGRRTELCAPVPLERQAYRILEAGVVEARKHYIEDKAEQALADGAPIDRSECEPDAETTFEVEWTRDQLATILHKEDGFSELSPNQKAVIKSAMRRLRSLVKFAQGDAGLVSNADDNWSRRLAIRLRLRKSGQP